MKRIVPRIFLLLPLFLSVYAKAQADINPLDYGLREAHNGIERYKVLLKCHKDAISKGLGINYTGIDTIRLEIPTKSQSIPMPNVVDFAGVTIVILNNAKNQFLFNLSQKGEEIKVNKQSIDRGDFRKVEELNKGLKILVVKDNNLWVDNRVGYSYGATRKDILLLQDGKSQNKVIASYNNEESAPSCFFCDVTKNRKEIKNLTIIRDSASLYKTFLIKIENQNNVCLEHITILTPPNSFYGDQAISINNSTNITLCNIKASGSFSQINKYGYIFSMNNLWNTTFNQVDADAVWGVMGNNNMNHTVLKNCLINRFDIHCYGRDIQLINCTIRKSERAWYCGGSSIYGKIIFDRCYFNNTSPYANGDSYKTYVPCEVVFNDCVFEVTKKKNAIVSTAKFNNDLNPRKGLGQKCLPNLTVNNMKIYVPKGVKEVYLFKLGNEVSYEGKVGNLRKVIINGLELICEDEIHPAELKLSNADINTEHKVLYKTDKIRVSFWNR